MICDFIDKLFCITFGNQIYSSRYLKYNYLRIIIVIVADLNRLQNYL